MSQQGAFTAAYLEALQLRYLATENPVFVWAAIDWCRNEQPQQQLPDWCVDHLAEVAARLNALTGAKSSETIDGIEVTSVGSVGKGVGRTPRTPKPTEILHALGFTSKGRNAVKDAGSKQRAIRAAIQFATLRKTGSSFNEALKEVMNWLGEPDETNAKKILNIGNRLLGIRSNRSDKSSKTSQ